MFAPKPSKPNSPSSQTPSSQAPPAKCPPANNQPSSQAPPQPPDPYSPTSLSHAGSAGPSSGEELASSHTGTEGSVSQSGKSRQQVKRKSTEKSQPTSPLNRWSCRMGQCRAALALKAREPSFVVYNIPAECEPSILAPPSLPGLQPFGPALELAERRFGFFHEEKGTAYFQLYGKLQRPHCLPKTQKRLLPGPRVGAPTTR